MPRLTRRHWLLHALALSGLPRALSAGASDEDDIPFLDDADFITDAQSANPRVKNFDLRRLSAPLTPAGEFFVFHQTTTPQIALEKWRLQVGGWVERPRVFSMAELTASGLPSHELEVTIECAGNTPRKETMNGQVSNARWSGFSLAPLLQRCGLRSEAREVVFFGADQARDASGVASGPHGRSVFVQDALDPAAMLATKMNGEPLPADHGFPMRLILPGWYGMAQIKWLSRIEVLDRRYEGLHMSRNYHTLHAVPADGGNPLYLATSIARTRMKSVVARVTRRKGGASAYRVIGAAWGGSTPIARIEVRIDNGPWQDARIDQQRGKYAWLLWSYDWKDALPGQHVLTSRASDASGNLQPTAGEWTQQIRSGRENNAQWERKIHLPA